MTDEAENEDRSNKDGKEVTAPHPWDFNCPAPNHTVNLDVSSLLRKWWLSPFDFDGFSDQKLYMSSFAAASWVLYLKVCLYSQPCYISGKYSSEHFNSKQFGTYTYMSVLIISWTYPPIGSPSKCERKSRHILCALVILPPPFIKYFRTPKIALLTDKILAYLPICKEKGPKLSNWPNYVQTCPKYS